MRVDGKYRASKGIHHDAVGALPAHLGEGAQELFKTIVGPLASRIERALAESPSQGTEGSIKARGLLGTEASGADQPGHDSARRAEQIVPCRETLFEHVECGLICLLPG